MDTPTVTVRRASVRPVIAADRQDPAWARAEPMRIAHYHPRSSDHRPEASLRLLHDGRCFYALFEITDDRHVRAVHTEYDSDTYKDSCVELFVRPGGREGYFAFEVNCGGAFSLRYIIDPTRTENRFAKWARVDWAQAERIEVATSMPRRVEPELPGPVSWRVVVSWPLGVMEPYCGPLGDLSGQRWAGNAFKCGDETSHPHWGSWSPIGEALNFHAPEHFGTLNFE